MSANVNHNTLENTVNKVSPQVIISTDYKYVSLCSNWVRNTFTSAAHVRVRSNHFHHIEYCGRVVATQAIKKVSREPVRQCTVDVGIWPVFLGSVPLDQKFRFEFPKFSYVKWNGIFDLALLPLEHISYPELTRQNAEGSWSSEVAFLSAVSCFT